MHIYRGVERRGDVQVFGWTNPLPFGVVGRIGGRKLNLRNESYFSEASEIRNIKKTG